jgi:hypothetical protein
MTATDGTRTYQYYRADDIPVTIVTKRYGSRREPLLSRYTIRSLSRYSPLRQSTRAVRASFRSRRGDASRIHEVTKDMWDDAIAEALF